MRIAPSLVIPHELELARTNGDLVIFAGAGVSMGPPANLPDFKTLARKIAEPVIGWDESRYGDTLDMYLGDAERAGVKVQERARDVLQKPGSRHTPAHEHLVSIFGAADRVRLITTNFDPFFEDALKVVYPALVIPKYRGPALPPGGGFRGLAYLHGALEIGYEKLVLTDADFGSAYLAEGWAARFLVPVFASRTVLFVGYSLSDPVMRYLMQALPRTEKWFAMCHEDDREYWSNKSIIPLAFQTAGGDKHADLYSGLHHWSVYGRSTALWHDQELRRVVAGAPPVALIDSDYVRARLRITEGRRTFWDSAKGEKWFWWASTERLFDAFTDDTADDTEIAGWSSWVFANFGNDQSPPLLAYLRRKGLTLHAGFAHALALHVWREMKSLPKPVVRQYVALIVNQSGNVKNRVDFYGSLFGRLVEERLFHEALALLRWLTSVRLLEIEPFFIVDDDGGVATKLNPLANQISLRISARDLADDLERYGPTLAKNAADSLLEIGVKRLHEMNELLSLASAEDSSVNLISFGRTAIASSNQDLNFHGLDVLILIVRLAFDEYAQSSQTKLIEFASKAETSDNVILRRLALYAYSKHSSLDTDMLFEKAVRNEWSEDLWLRPEFYALLKSHYARASETAKQRFISGIPKPSSEEVEADEFAGHPRFSLSQKLARLAPNSRATMGFAAEEVAQHPEWGEGDPDGYLSRTEVGWGGAGVSPVSSAEMLEWATGEAFQSIVRLLVENSEATRWSILGAIQQASSSNAGWAMAVLGSTLESANPPGGLLDAVVWGLRDSAFSRDEQIEFLRCFATFTLPAGSLLAVSSLADRWSRDLELDIAPTLLDALDAVADKVYDASSADEPAISDGSWLDRAINHPAGHAAFIWWNVAVARDRMDTNLITIDEREKDRWQRVLQDDSAAGDFARPIAGMASDRFSGGDLAWARSAFFTQFDVSNNTKASAQLWDGRLSQSRITGPTVEALKPYLPAFLRDSSTIVPSKSRELGDFVALFVANQDKSNFTLELLQDFVRGATSESRVAFADAIPRHLTILTADQRRTVWREILHPYWRDRRTNVPTPLTPEEIREMMSWVVALHENAREVLSELKQTPVSEMPHADYTLIEWTHDDSWIREHPSEATGVIGYLAQSDSIEPWNSDDAVALLEIALSSGCADHEVQAAAELVATSTGGKRARDLASRLKR